MIKMQISLPDALKLHVDEQVARLGYADSSAYICDLIARDVERQRLKAALLQGGASAQTSAVDGIYFENLRQRARGLD